MLQCTQTGPQEIPVNDCTINLFIVMHYYDLVTPISCNTYRQTDRQTETENDNKNNNNQNNYYAITYKQQFIY